jgi:pyruvate carboxylase subunit B
MELIVTSGGEQYRLRLRRNGATYEVEMGERTVRVEAVGASGDGLRSLLIDGVQHEVAVQATGDGLYWVSGRRQRLPVTVIDPLTHLAEASHGPGGGSGRRQVTAYMPGRVTAVLVEEGTEVEAGQGVVVLEAMKMENEIQAENAGVIRRILVEAGQAVEGGDPLFEIE